MPRPMSSRRYLFLTLIFSGFLVGCDVVITQEEMKKAEKICEKNGGLKQAQLNPFGSVVYAHCKDGAYFHHKSFPK